MLHAYDSHQKQQTPPILQRQLHQSRRLWSLINSFDINKNDHLQLHELLAVAHILEERIELATLQLNNGSPLPLQRRPHTSSIIDDIILFFSQPEIHCKQVKFSSSSLSA
jgi:hypothetical protein